MRKARAGKKRWDTPFSRQLPRSELVRKSPREQWHVVADASPPRVTGRDLEARGLAKRLFPPDPILEMDDESEHDRRSFSSLTSRLQIPQEPLYHQPTSNNQTLTPITKAGPSCEIQSTPPQSLQPPQYPLVSSISPPQTNPESLPSPLDGSPPPSTTYLPRSVSSTKPREHPECRCKHCGYPRSESSVPQSPNVASTVPKELSPPGGRPLYHTCQHTSPCHAPMSCLPGSDKESPMACECPSSTSADPQRRTALSPWSKVGSKAIPLDTSTSRAADEQPPMLAAEPPKTTLKESLKDAVKNNPRDAAKAYSSDVPRASNAPKAGMKLWHILLFTMGIIIFVFAFAILVAHCLAWFLVYKTEARLGEIRSGLLRGGEMKLCLCGRGG